MEEAIVSYNETPIELVKENQSDPIDVDCENEIHSVEAQKLYELTKVFRHRIMRIKRTIRRVYPEIERERKDLADKIRDRITAFNMKPIENRDSENDAFLIDMLADYKVPFTNTFLRGMFFSIFSELDAFTEQYLSALFELKPVIIIGNQKSFIASEVFECDNIDTFKRKVIQKEIDAIKRESYIEQISYLEKTFNISTLRKFANWSKYIEITQRRNIVMHNDSKISEQYRKICAENSVYSI